MFESYTGKHADPESVARNKKRSRCVAAAASIAMAVTLNGSSNRADMSPPTAEAVSAFDAECSDADAMKIVDSRGNEVVVVRLDCVPDDKVNKKGAAVISLFRSNRGIASGVRADNKSMYEASCRLDIPSLAVDYEGESTEWVRLVDRSQASSFDGMPEIDVMMPKEKYINSAYVVGEKSLPNCNQAI